MKKTKDPIIVSGKFGDDKAAMALYNTTLENAPRVLRTIASNIYQNAYSPNISIRDSMDRLDYDYYRPGEAIPTDDKGKIAACMSAYSETGNGIIKNIIDLMADLTVQGIDVAHSKKRKEKFAKAWFHKTVNGPAFSERFANLLCRTANNIVKRNTGKISLKKVRELYRGIAKPTSDFPSDSYDIVAREIPVGYTLLHPLSVDVVRPELNMFLNNKNVQFVLNIPSKVASVINQPMTDVDREFVAMLPKDIVQAVRKGEKKLPLSRKNVSAYYYKKDDWQVWAEPMTYTVLSDVQQLKKIKLSDLAALDGVLAQIRVWKLGSLEHNIKPGLPAINKLANILMSTSTSGGILDLIWGPDIELQEVSSTLHNFLGETKYLPTLNAIYTGLGIPPLFTGSTNQGSFTNNFLAIKTLIVRLEYIRDKLIEFWNTELELLQKAMGWDEPAVLVFDRMTLNDESSIMQIMLHLVDRGLLSGESIQEMIGAMPEIEKFRVKREWEDQKKGKSPPKASPFHKPDFENSWIEKFIQMGELAPSQIGIELEDIKDGEVTPNDNKFNKDKKMAKLKPKVEPQPINDLGGRPSGKKDTTKRKQKQVKPRQSVSANELVKYGAFSNETQKKINDYLTPNYLKMLEKKNLRQLTTEEFNTFERLKFSILASTVPFSSVDTEFIKELLGKELKVPEIMDSLVDEMIKIYASKNGNQPTIDKVREFQVLAYAAYYIDNGI